MERKSELQIYSFNCQSFNSKRVIIDTILKKCDVLCLQETFIYEANSNLYDNFDDNFSYAYAPAVRKGDTTSGRAPQVEAWLFFGEIMKVPVISL